MPDDEIDIESESGGTTVGKIGGRGNLVGEGNIAISGGVVVLNMSQADEHGVATIRQLFRAPNIDPAAALTAVKSAPLRQDAAPVVDALLEKMDTTPGGTGPKAVQAGDVTVTSFELMIKKSVLLKAEADETADADEKAQLLGEAHDLLQRVLEQDPTNTDAMLQDAIVLIDLTPDDPNDEIRLFERVRKLLFSPANDAELLCLARATFLLAVNSRPVQRGSLEDARLMFEKLGRPEWVRQCDDMLASLRGNALKPSGQPEAGLSFDLGDPSPAPIKDSGKTPTGPVFTPPEPVNPFQEVFNPVGNWTIQVTDGSTMTAAIYPNGRCDVTQVNPLFGINIAASGQWAWVPAMANLQIQGLIQGMMPFAMSLFITGRNGQAYIGYGTDGHGYQFVRN